MALIQSTPVPLFTGRPTGIPIMHDNNQTPLDSWPQYTYNQLDSSSGQFQPASQPAQIAYQQQQSASNLAFSTATSSSFQSSNQHLPHPSVSDNTRTSPSMAQYAQDTMGGHYIHYTQQFVGSAPEPPHNANHHHNTASHLSPLRTHQPLSHTRGIPISPQAAQPMHVPMQMTMPEGFNGYQPQSMPELPFRTPGHLSHDITSPGQPMMMLAEGMGDDRNMYQPAERLFAARYNLQSAQEPVSPVKVQGWPHGGHRADAAFVHGPQTPLVEKTMMVIENEGWESQEPARKTARAVIANLTEQERLERRREQNRVSQAKLRKTRDAQYEKVCQEKKDLQESYDQLRSMYNQATAELSYFHDKELVRYNAKREQKGMTLYASFEELVSVESDLASQIHMRQEQRQKEDEERMKEQRSREELLKQQEKHQGLQNRRSSDEHSQSAASEQMDQPPSSSGTDTSLTSVPASLSTVNGGQVDSSPFSYTVSSSTHGPTRRAAPYVTKAPVRSRKACVTSPSKKVVKRRPTSQRSEDAATTELSNSMLAMTVPIPDYGQQPQVQMQPMSAPSEAAGYNFMAQGSFSGLTR